MTKKIIIYECMSTGYGCIEREIEATSENFISETDDTITISDLAPDNWGGMVDSETTYFKSIDAFIKNENEWYVKHIQELRERHEHTLRMANEFKEKGLTFKESLIQS